METETRNLRKEISEKLKDETLRDALGRFSDCLLYTSPSPRDS